LLRNIRSAGPGGGAAEEIHAEEKAFDANTASRSDDQLQAARPPGLLAGRRAVFSYLGLPLVSSLLLQHQELAGR
jgi:hypothetical protein